MTLRPMIAAAAALTLSLSAVAAHAGTLFDMPGSTGEKAVDTTYAVSFASPYAGAATLSFVLDGYSSLDGQNWYEDDFTLSLNGTAIAKGTWNLGGGGTDAVYFAPVGATFDNVSGNGLNITWTGGHVNVTTPLALTAGTNTLSFNYHALTTDHAGWQDMGDEGWGVSQVHVDGAPGGVPEPATWALMIMGFGSLGAAMRRRRALALA